VEFGERTLLSPVYTSFDKRNGNKLSLIIGLFFLTSAFFLLMLELAFKVDYQYGVQLGIFKERKKRVRKKVIPPGNTEPII
jgi:hypothetical protein